MIRLNWATSLGFPSIGFLPLLPFAMTDLVPIPFHAHDNIEPWICFDSVMAFPDCTMRRNVFQPLALNSIGIDLCSTYAIMRACNQGQSRMSFPDHKIVMFA